MQKSVRSVVATAAAGRRRGGGGGGGTRLCSSSSSSGVDSVLAGRSKYASRKEQLLADEKAGKVLGWMDKFDPTLPKDPEGAKGTVMEDVVRHNKLRERLPDWEYKMWADGTHPAMPDLPKGSGDFILDDDTSIGSAELTVGEETREGRMKRHQSLREIQEQERMKARDAMRDTIAAKVQQGLDMGVGAPKKDAAATPSSFVPTLGGSGGAASAPKIVLPGGGGDPTKLAKVNMGPMFTADYTDLLPPAPDHPPPVRRLTKEEVEYSLDMEHKALAQQERVYDDAYQRWKAQKKLEKQRKYPARVLGPEEAAEEQTLRIEAQRQMDERAKARLEEEGDPLDNLEAELFPERFEAQDVEDRTRDADFEEKKARARLNLKPMPSELTLEIQKNIQTRGPMPLAEFMKEAMFHPRSGYYTTKKKVFGRDGDFITSPEVSVMYGESIAAWAVDTWTKLGKPRAFHLVEMGGGKGTLMARVLRSAMGFPDFHAAVRVGMVEVSPVLQEAQREALTKEMGEAFVEEKVHWCESVEGLEVHHEQLPIVAFCNELFDCFAVSKFQYTERGWCEWMVDVDTDPENPEHFKFVLSHSETGASLSYLPHEVRNDVRENRKLGYTIELQMGGYLYLEYFLNEMIRLRGALLVIDYGVDDYVGDSLRGILGHEYVHPLSAPGEVDLSAFVSFKMLRATVERNAKLDGKIHVSSAMSQGEFLRRVGIEARAAHHLTKVTKARDAARITREFTQLTDEEDDSGMGRRFKAMCFSTTDTKHNLVPPCPW